ncbi:MAG: LacI family DNA-binding transcriptional regulator [Chloroflexota bacterium]
MDTITIRDVAKKAGVGVGTVSRVLNDSSSVSANTRKKVQFAIEELQYTPNPAARRLSRGKTMVIGAIVPYFTNPSVVRRLQGVVATITESDYDLILFDIESEDRRDVFLRNVPRRHIVDGLLVISFTPTDEEAGYLLESQIPVVLIDAYHPSLSRVIVDNISGGYQATKYLIDLGHRQIGFISDYLEDPFNSPVRHRFEGYKKALAEADISFNPDYHRQGIHGRSQANEMTRQLMALHNPPTAIFAYSDTQAIGVMEAARELGIKIPDQLSVIGFDNIEAAEYLRITTIRQALHESGVNGCNLLLELMETPVTTPIEITLPTMLECRDTTAPPGSVQ